MSETSHQARALAFYPKLVNTLVPSLLLCTAGQSFVLLPRSFTVGLV